MCAHGTADEEKKNSYHALPRKRDTKESVSRERLSKKIPKDKLEEPRSQAKTRERGRPESEGSTRQRNIRIKDAEEEGSPSHSERAVVTTRCTVYTEARRSGDLDSGVICEARCVVPLSRTSCTLLRRG